MSSIDASYSRLEDSTKPAVEHCGERRLVELEGDFKAPSKWRGYPSDAIDTAWKSITDVGAMVVEEKEIENLGKLRDSSVVLSHNQQSGYMVSIEAFHQVHCLDLLRKYSYIDYYKAKEPDFFNSPNVRTHAGMPCCSFFFKLLRKIHFD
ncbi:hypothetical protein GGI43DRAFT_381571 [Trichoderma evansii]